ncbi:hypothetical protein PMAYCL1PPCAC_07483, partial [Pristionchus mayeri]
MNSSRLVEFNLQCKIIENGPELEALLASEQMKVQSRVQQSNGGNEHGSEEEVAATSSSRHSSLLDLVTETIICRVMFVYFSDGIHYKKCSLERGSDCPLQEMLRAMAARAGLPAQKCRVFGCNKTWGDIREVDMHQSGYASLMNFPVGRSHRLNFIVDYVN